MPRPHRPEPALAGRIGLGFGTLLLTAASAAATPEACIDIYKKGVLKTPFNPAMLNVVDFKQPDGKVRQGLLMSSFYNAEKDPTGEKVTGFFGPDLVARIPDLDSVDPASFDASKQLEVLSDRDGKLDTVWPNKTDLVPKDALPFEAVLMMAGFLAAEKPGHLTIINLDDPKRTEYVVDPINEALPVCKDGKIDNKRWYYHQSVWHDMDGDGLKDIVAVRASFKPWEHKCPPSGELLYFKNPGANLKADVPWEPRVLVGLPDDPTGPEINIDLADLEGDGVPEFITTSFSVTDHVTLFGAPVGGEWKDLSKDRPIRRKVIMTGQGRPFKVSAVDLNLDGKLDILTSNHQGDGCFPNTQDKIPGRVIALEQPDSGKLFDDPWPVHILKDNIRPNPSLPAPTRPPGRLAPSLAKAFWPVKWQEGRYRPWIVVGGDEASKVWVLKPPTRFKSDDWTYESFVIFDINDHYGPNTTQTIRTEKPKGEVISTVGGLDWRYDKPGAFGRAELYAPVFEAMEIQVFSFRESAGKPVNCPADVTVACAAPK